MFICANPLIEIRRLFFNKLTTVQKTFIMNFTLVVYHSAKLLATKSVNSH